MNSEREKIISNLFKKADLQDSGLRVLSISTDKNIFKMGSIVRERMVEYGKSFDQLHIIIFTKKFQKFKSEKISENVWIYPTKSWTRWFYSFDAVKVAKSQFTKFLPKIINVISTQDPFETAVAGWLLARRFKLPLQIQIHTDFLNKYFWEESFLNKIRVIIGRFLVKQANCIRVVSERIKHSLGSIDANLKKKCAILPIFIDTEKLRSTPAVFNVHKKYPQFSFIILMVSRLEKEKNIALAVEIMRELTAHYPKTGMLIVGEGKERNALEHLVKKFNLKDNVIFEGWQNDLISYYKTANVFLSTSLYEGYGLAIIEALSCGCPVISSDAGIASEVIFEGDSGFICPVDDVNCFIRRIIEIMEVPSLKERLSVNSKAIASEKLTETKESYLKKYKETLKSCFSDNI